MVAKVGSMGRMGASKKSSTLNRGSGKSDRACKAGEVTDGDATDVEATVEATDAALSRSGKATFIFSADASLLGR